MLEEREHVTGTSADAKVDNPNPASLYGYGEERPSSRHMEHQAP